MIACLTGKDTISINGRILNDFGDMDTAHLTFPNDLMVVKTGKNGNAIYAFNAPGQQAEIVLRVLRGSSDDKFLNGILSQQRADPSGFVLMTGTFVKNLGDGAGNIQSDTYIMSGGVFKKQNEVKENVDGDTEQAISIYTMTFGNSPRTIG